MRYFLLIAAAFAVPLAAAPQENIPLTAEGWGPLRIGMTQAEVVAALGSDSDPAVGAPEPESCDQWRPTRAPAGILVMIEEGRLTSISLFGESAIRTDAGIGLGATAGEVRAIHGPEIRATPHHYEGDGAEYLTIWTRSAPAGAWSDDPDARGIMYETNEQGVVKHIAAGGSSIQYIEGCA